VQAADVKARLAASTGVDTNAGRDFSQPGALKDVVTSLLGDASARWQWERAQLLATYDLGIRRYLMFPLESMLVQGGQLEGTLALGKHLGLGIDGQARDRRVLDRDYTDLASGVFAELVPDAAVDLRVRAGGRRFLYPQAHRYSFGALEVQAHGRYRLDLRNAVLVFGDFSDRRHAAAARARPSASEETGLSWRDGVLTAGLTYSHRGPVTASLTYAFTDLSSNSFGESLSRHRLIAALGTRLPWELVALLQGSVQLTRYPDGVVLSPDFQIDVEEENQNSVSAKLVRPISEHVDVEARYGLYHAVFEANGLTYLRHLGWVGLSWRL
jgi:hypothetical protein